MNRVAEKGTPHQLRRLDPNMSQKAKSFMSATGRRSEWCGSKLELPSVPSRSFPVWAIEPACRGIRLLSPSVCCCTRMTFRSHIRFIKTPKRWTAAELHSLGRLTDAEVARRTGRFLASVRYKWIKLGIPRAAAVNRRQHLRATKL